MDAKEISRKLASARGKMKRRDARIWELRHEIRTLELEESQLVAIRRARKQNGRK